MAEVKIFTVGQDFINYIESIGYKECFLDSPKKYYVNEKGRQIVINNYKKEIRLLDKKGNVVNKQNSFTDEQIKEFSDVGIKVLNLVR